jgi:hypothetical protein
MLSTAYRKAGFAIFEKIKPDLCVNHWQPYCFLHWLLLCSAADHPTGWAALAIPLINTGDAKD